MTRMTALALATVFGLAACGDAEMDEVPETAEVEVEEGLGQLELDEELVLGPDDIGETLMATGWVSGAPLPNGFFLRTEDDRVIFVSSTEEVASGDVVRVVGPLVSAQVAAFEGWESDAFEAGFEAEWDVETVAYIDATTVTHMDGGAMPMEGGDAQPMSDTTSGDGEATAEPVDGGEVDPGSKSG